jgi:Fic family protein
MTQAPPITPEMLYLIAQLDEAKGQWQALKTLAPERLLALRHSATIESIGSSTRIEGVKLSNVEVERLLASLNQTSFATRDEQQVAGYARAMERVFESWADLALNENHLRQLHAELLQFSDKDTRHRGEYKTHPNHVAAFGPDGKMIGIVFETSTPFDTPFEMRKLLDWHREAELVPDQWHPLLRIGVFIVRFLAVHPFQDGNGRLSRVLTTLLLLQAGYAYVPYSSLECVIEANKEVYYLALRQTQTTLKQPEPAWHPWLLFFLKALKTQKDRLLSRLDAEQQALATLTPLARSISELLASQSHVSVASIVAVTGASRNTVKATLSRMLQTGLLVRHGSGRAVHYTKR